jgi:hypothetical protein
MEKKIGKVDWKKVMILASTETGMKDQKVTWHRKGT